MMDLLHSLRALAASWDPDAIHTQDLRGVLAVHTLTRDPWVVRTTAHGLQFYLRRDNTWRSALELAGLWTQEEAATLGEAWMDRANPLHDPYQTVKLSTVISEMEASNAG